MNDYRNVADYHKNRPVLSIEEIMENSGLLLEYYNKYKKGYGKAIKKNNGFITNKTIDNIFTKIINEKEIPIEEAYLVDGFFDIVINLVMENLSPSVIDSRIAMILGESVHKIVKK